MKTIALMIQTFITFLMMIIGDLVTFLFDAVLFIILILQVPIALFISKMLDKRELNRTE
jgi:hypothetical protein